MCGVLLALLCASLRAMSSPSAVQFSSGSWAHLALKALNKPSPCCGLNGPFGWDVNLVNNSFHVETAVAMSL